MEKKEINTQDVDNLVNMLDSFASSDVSRMKIRMSDDLKAGESQKVYHHGRCDVGSAWAKGCSFDVIDPKEKK